MSISSRSWNLFRLRDVDFGPFPSLFGMKIERTYPKKYSSTENVSMIHLAIESASISADSTIVD